MTTLTIKLFGTLSLERDDQKLTRFPSKRVKDLLSYLLLNRDTLHPRSHLAGLFWPEIDERRARHCLNTALWRLNQVLAQEGRKEHPFLRVDAETIGFNTASDFRLDVAEFESHCMLAQEVGSRSRDQQAALYRQAVDLYGGELLVECYDDWCIVERERLSRLYLRALARLVAYYGQAGEHDVAVEYARCIIQVDPLREEAHRDLIGLYLDARQPAAALRQYRACEDALRRELGVDPMPETQALLPRILDATGPVMLTERRAAKAGKQDISSRGTAEAVASALLTLQQAVMTFETAYVRLLDATALVTEVADNLGCDISLDAVELRDNDLGAARFNQVRRLVSEAAMQLERVAEASSA